MTARLPANNPARGAGAGLPLAEWAAMGIATAAPEARKLRRVAAVMFTGASHAAGNGWGVAAIGGHFAALAIHVVRPRPVRQREMRAVLVASLGRGFEDAVDAHEVLPTPRVVRVRVEDGAGLVLVEHAVAGDVLDPGIAVAVVVVRAAGRHVFGFERHTVVVVELRTECRI